MYGARSRYWITLFAVGFLVGTIACGCGGGSSTPPPQLSVSFSGGTSQVIGQGQSVTITAVVSNDSSGRGVTWTLGGPGVLNEQSSTSVEYDAPANVAGNATATVTATAVADPRKSAVYTVNLVVVTVSVSPASASVAVNTTQIFVATVQNDSSNAGVVWSLTQGGTPCSPGCGSITPVNSASGAPVTYTTPRAVPANTAVTLTATSAADTTRSAVVAITIAPPLPISVSVSPSATSVEVNTGFGFTATVLNDGANGGVTWSLVQVGIPCSPGCGTVSPTSTASGALVTYTAPATLPANPTVTLLATSVTDATESASAAITVVLPPISVSVGPRSALMGVNATQQFTATVQNDAYNKGVTWALAEAGSPCSPGCGTVAPTNTASGEATTYTAPATLQSSYVTLTATSLTDPSKSNCNSSASVVCVTITITNGTVKLVPASVDFGRIKIGSTVTEDVTLTNTGAATLKITNVAITGTGASDFSQTNTCGGSVATGGTCAIKVSFTPVGLFNTVADLVITDSSADSPQQVGLKGKGNSSQSAAMQSALTDKPTTTTPIPSGPSSVGTRTVHLVDSARKDPYADNGTKRELLVRFWYPASIDKGCEPAEYTSPGVWNYFSKLIAVHLPEVSTTSCLNAPAADGQHPIVLFTHGYTGTFTDYTFLFEDLASRGYIVASIDHTYEATAVEFPDGRLVESIPGSHFGNIRRNDASELAFAVNVRLGDLKFVADQLQSLNISSGSPFAGKLDTAHLAIAGHSLGGLTAFLALEQEPKFMTAVVLDGVVPDSPINLTEKPVLILTAGHNPNDWSSGERHLWSELHGPRFLVNLRGAEHLTPTDLVWLAHGAIRTGTMGPDKTIAAIRDYVASFLDASLRGQPLSTLLVQPPVEYPDVDLTPPTTPVNDRN
jgi:predicted dienelactone hydrolase